MRAPTSRRLRALVLGCLVAALAGCGPTLPSAQPSSPPATTGPTVATTAPAAEATDAASTYAVVAAQVEAIRHLQPTASVTPVVIDQATLSANLTADFDASNPKAVVENSQRELIALGLLPPGTSLRAVVLALQSGQVAGYYSPERNELFVVSRAGGIGPTQRLTYAHEFTHQLQDQHFDLAKLDLQASDQGDRSLARLSLVEGDAVSAQQSWMLSLSQNELAQVLTDALDPAGLAALNDAPPILRETSLFPYAVGLAFVQRLMAQGGYDSVNAAFGDPPASTEQIIHPEKYRAHEAPIVVTPPTGLAKRLGSGWSELARDTLGEEVLRVWLGMGGVAAGDATAAGAGWGGDRLVMFGGPNGATAIVIETAWDSTEDATEFAAAARTAISGLHLNGGVVDVVAPKTLCSSPTCPAMVSVAIGPAGVDVGPLLAVLPS